MCGSFGSYSSMGASAWEPINISSSSSSTSRTDDANSCAYPSWPRRDSLSSNEHTIPNSFLSDDDLFLLSDSDDLRSESSFGSGSPAEDDNTLVMSPNNRFLECQREREVLYAEQQYQRQQQRIQQREMIKMVQLEKERRKAAAKKTRRTKKNVKLTSISE
ncbi:hypothetical protein Cpir12675_000047 [Ceratocystis pirilliformis]|uniref:Uncharacterized protein n=1 Tax=Ceratocystis pirilliformis TaxID=259994 RepID=A0ABR3ZPR7_9PEZI